MRPAHTQPGAYQGVTGLLPCRQWRNEKKRHLLDQGSHHEHDKEYGRSHGHRIARVSPNWQKDKNFDRYLRADRGCDLCRDCGAEFRNAFNFLSRNFSFPLLSTTRWIVTQNQSEHWYIDSVSTDILTAILKWFQNSKTKKETYLYPNDSYGSRYLFFPANTVFGSSHKSKRRLNLNAGYKTFYLNVLWFWHKSHRPRRTLLFGSRYIALNISLKILQR